MDNQAVLEKAIRLAIDGGWLGVKQIDNPTRIYYYPDSTEILKWRWEDDNRCFSDGEYDDYESINVETIIFNHDFAKALWGNEGWCFRCKENMVHSEHKDWCPDGYDMGPIYDYHLQQMVISKDPITYLGAHL